jgi:molybdenum cofactor cytidylyltransferase
VIYQNSAYLVHNRNPERGQFSSLREGLQAVLDRGRDAACVTLVDRPPARAETLSALKAEFMKTVPEKTWAVVPEFQGKHGHPVIFGREMMEVFLRADANRTAREIEHEFQSRIRYATVDDSGVILNINTPEDYSSFLQTT